MDLARDEISVVAVLGQLRLAVFVDGHIKRPAARKIVVTEAEGSTVIVIEVPAGGRIRPAPIERIQIQPGSTMIGREVRGQLSGSAQRRQIQGQIVVDELSEVGVARREQRVVDDDACGGLASHTLSEPRIDKHAADNRTTAAGIATGK